MTLSTYLYFDGQCELAFDYYKKIFGGEFQVIQRYSDGPPELAVPANEQSRIMHVSLPIGDSILMGSDSVNGQGEPLQVGNNFAISYAPKTKSKADKIFPLLSDGGAVAMELQETFWGSYFGMCKDKFGVRWMINVDLSQS